MRTTIGAASKMVSLSRGLYARIARRAGCDVSYVSRIARGERRSEKVEALLDREFRIALQQLNLEFAPDGEARSRRDRHRGARD
jgi:transcriptional regulator with XRE-family HTH domain